MSPKRFPQFSELLLRWYAENGRTLPWRGEKDPYKIWVSEIILQQTRVSQGWNYYLQFIRTFPDVSSLAAADERDVLKVWQGLGYYSRARNMHAAAQTIVTRYNGTFPHTYAELLKLKGIGDYTAAAIASFAFDENVPAVDGNVLRVICRLYGIFDDIALPATRKRVTQLCHELMPPRQAATFNQAIMDFGATLCTPKHPDCNACPCQTFCFAFQHEKTNLLPIKTKKVNIKKRYFHYIIYFKDNQVIIQQKTADDIWKNLFEFPLTETDSSDFSIQNGIKIRELKHQLTHQTIFADFYLLKVKRFPKLTEHQQIVPLLQLTKFPMSKIVAEMANDLHKYI